MESKNQTWLCLNEQKAEERETEEAVKAAIGDGNRKEQSKIMDLKIREGRGVREGGGEHEECEWKS